MCVCFFLQIYKNWKRFAHYADIIDCECWSNNSIVEGLFFRHRSLKDLAIAVLMPSQIK